MIFLTWYSSYLDDESTILCDWENVITHNEWFINLQKCPHTVYNRTESNNTYRRFQSLYKSSGFTDIILLSMVVSSIAVYFSVIILKYYSLFMTRFQNSNEMLWIETPFDINQNVVVIILLEFQFFLSFWRVGYKLLQKTKEKSHTTKLSSFCWKRRTNNALMIFFQY